MTYDQVRVVLVDDSPLFVQRIIKLLHEFSMIAGIKVASSYEEAVKILDKEMPDVALLDINLPGKSGIEVLKRIRSVNTTCCVIMVTNQVDDYYRSLCQNLGANYFFDKTN